MSSTAAKVIYEGEAFRVVRRDLERWSTPYFDIERKTTDALGAPAWISCCGVDSAGVGDIREERYPKALVVTLLVELARHADQAAQ